MGAKNYFKRLWRKVRGPLRKLALKIGEDELKEFADHATRAGKSVEQWAIEALRKSLRAGH